MTGADVGGQAYLREPSAPGLLTCRVSPPPLSPPPSSGFQIYAKWLQEVDTVRVTQLERGYVDAIRRLWADMGIRVCYSRRCEYQLLDSTE